MTALTDARQGPPAAHSTRQTLLLRAEGAASFVAAPALLAGVVAPAEWSLGLGLALIWVAHIAADRALGYGLRSPEGFGVTHMERIGLRS